MLIDATSLPDGHIVRTDVCVIGGGPAGLTLARELAGGSLDVAVLESGATDPEQTPAEIRTQIDGTVAGVAYPPLDTVRGQGLGGTTPMWVEIGQSLGVRLRPLESSDFERREWLPHSGWPFGRAALDPFYRRAEDAFGIGRFAPDVAQQSPDGATCPLAVGDLVSNEFRFARRRSLHEAQRRVLDSARNVTVYTFATVSELDCGDTDHTVRRAHVRTAPGHGFVVEARWFVLAAGGIDNARMLLLSNRTHPAGIGNDHDVVGRYFADHPGHKDTTLVLNDPGLLSRLSAYDIADRDGVGIIRAVSVDTEQLEREQIMHSWTVVRPRISDRFLNAISAARDVTAALRPPRDLAALPRRAVRHAGALFRGIEPFARALASGTRTHVIPPGWSSRPPTASLYEPGLLTLESTFEQAPDPGSRITLGAGVDRLGMRLPHLDYRWNDLDLQTVRRTTEIIAKAVAGAGIGTIRMEAGTDFPDPTKLSSAHHPLGTTRMHQDPRHGVVDADCRVHGISNLSVTGSSTFPTGGSANPTLTIVALAIRLADHLKHRLG